MVKAIIYLVIFFLFMFGYVKYLENRGIYFPMKDIEFTPKDLGLSFEDVYINTKDNMQIHGWFIPHNSAKSTLLFCHGNAGNICHRLEKIIILHNLKLNILIIDYRGYGQSQGRPSERGIYLDTEAAYDYLVNERKINPKQLFLYGESLGTAAIIHLAAEKEVRALIVEGAFSRGREMARKVYPFLPAFLFADSFDNLSKIKKVSAEKLFIHSKDDEMVPFSLAMRLYDTASPPKRFVQLRGGHNTAYVDTQEVYKDCLKSFIEKLSQE